MSVAARPRLQTRSKPHIPLAVAALALLGGLGAWTYVSTRPETAVVARRDIVVSLPLEGEVVAPPDGRADIMAPYRAPVARVYASVGDRVSRGDVLVELSHPTAQTAYEQARQELTAAKAAYEAARRQYSAAVTAAERQLAEARTAERRAREGVAVSVEPSDAGASVTIREPAAEMAAATEARIATEQALLQAQVDHDAALTPYRQRLTAAQTAFREAQSGRKLALVRSPIYGTVLALNARPGQEIGDDRKTPVATVVDLGDLQVHAPMGAEEADSVRAGAPVTLSFRDVPGKQFEGKVSRITTEPARPLLGERRVAIIEFKNEDGLVKPEMKAGAAVQIGRSEDVLAVPSEAVDRDKSDRPVVEVLRDGRWQKVVVEPGLSDGRYTAIRSGLKEGETVKVTPDLL